MNRKIIFLTVILLIIIIASVVFFYPGRRASSVIVLSSSGWIDSVGDYQIAGEVQNTGSTNVRFVKISATFYSANNNTVDTQFSYAYLTYVQPNSKSPFNIVDINSNLVPQFNHYTLQVSYTTGSSIQQGLKILSNSSYTDNKGGFHVVGEIENTGKATSSSTEVYATFYDSSGKVVYASLAFANPENIVSGGTSSFEIKFTDSSRVPLIASYSLTAESSDYSMVSPNS